MLKLLLFILIFNTFYSVVQNFDISGTSNPKPVGNDLNLNISNNNREERQNNVKKDLSKTIVNNKTETIENVTGSENVAVKNNNISTTNVSVTERNNRPEFVDSIRKLHPGAYLRAFYVFLGLSVIIIIYFLVKSFRLRPGAAPPATVRKYGVVGRRNDMEMLPLPLSEEEEDDDNTLFEMGTRGNR